MDDHVRLCACGLHQIQIGCRGVVWYWSLHTELVCTMTEPDGPCWCGIAKSMHWNGHAPRAEHIDNDAGTERQRDTTRERMASVGWNEPHIAMRVELDRLRAALTKLSKIQNAFSPADIVAWVRKTAFEALRP